MKQWWKSKTLWVNAIGIGVIIAQSQFGYVVGPEVQASILGFINLALRMVTNGPVAWK